MTFSKSLLYRLLIFVVIYTLFNIIGRSKAVQDLHGKYFCSVSEFFFNLPNPHVYGEFSSDAPQNNYNWDTTFKIYDKRKTSDNLRKKSIRKNHPASLIMYNNPHDFSYLPIVLLLCLFIVSPLNWKQKTLAIILSHLIFQLFLSTYLAYRFEFTLGGESLPIDSIWHAIIGLLGLGGSQDAIYLVVILIWLLLFLKLKRINFQDLLNSLPF